MIYSSDIAEGTDDRSLDNQGSTAGKKRKY